MFKDEALEQFKGLLARTGEYSNTAARLEMAQALQAVLREGVLIADNLGGIFSREDLAPGTQAEWPLDILAPGDEDQFTAYTIPAHGKIPDRMVEGDYVRIPTYMIANAISWPLRVAREARYSVAQRAIEIFRAGFVKKMNDDGWAVLISSAADRNILVYDAAASAGQFTKRVISLTQSLMKRNGGGNAGSIRRARLTDIFGSVELVEDVRNWGIDQLDDTSRREIYLAEDGSAVLTTIYGVKIHEMDEFGEDQIYQDFFLNRLGGQLQAGDLELAIGLDLSKNDSFVMPVRQDIEVYHDDNFLREQKDGYWGLGELGFGSLDSRRTIAISF